MNNRWELVEDAPQAVPVQIPTQKEPGLLQSGLRKVARAGEAVGGLPGNIASGVLGVANYATGGTIPTYETVQKHLPLSLPTSSQARESVKKITGNYLEPKNGKDTFWDEVVSDFASFMAPIGGAVKAGTALTRAVGGNLAAKGAEQLGFGETGQAISKLAFNVGSMFPGSQKYFKAKSSQAYDLAEKAIPEGAKQNAKPLENVINKVEKYIYSGDKTTPEKAFLKDRVNALGSHISKGKIPVEQAWALKKDFNSLFKEPSTPIKAKKELGELVGALKGTLKDYGVTNPEFGRNFNIAEDIHTGLNKASAVNKFFQDHGSLKNILKNKTAKGIFGAALYKSGIAPVKSIGGLAGSYGIGQGIKSYELIKNSQQARNLYKDILKGAALKDISVVSRKLKQFDQVADKYEKEESENRWELL